MLETKEQKQILAGSITLIIILVLISVWHRPDFTVKDLTGQNQKAAFDYNAYLASIKIDPVASQKLFQQLITDDQVKQQVEEALQANQKIIAPAIDQTKIKTSTAAGRQAAVDYFTAVGRTAADFSDKTLASAQELFYLTQDQTQLEAAMDENNNLLNTLYATAAPREVLAFHKAALTIYLSYLDALSLARSYEQNPQADPWPKLYNDYAVINDSLSTAKKELDSLDQKYQISQLPINQPVAEKLSPLSVIPTANAFLGAGDTTVVIGDIPSAIEKAIEQGLASAFANFATQFLNDLISSIEKNYKIANFLYYSDALVNGEYVGDYLNKYVPNQLDQALVKNFIPQFNCGQAQNVKQILKAKADQYLGFDPQTLSPSDPQFYTKLARMGDFLASPQGWQLYYQDLATAAQSAAQIAANQELTSSGIKSPRDALGSQIATSLSSITGSMQAIFNAQLNLGVANSNQVVSQIVSQVTYNLFNKFVFSGAVVYKEQSTCLPVPQLTPIIPAQAGVYQPPQAPNLQQIQQQQCANSARGCQ